MNIQLTYKVALTLIFLICNLTGFASAETAKQKERKLNFYIREIENYAEHESQFIPLCDSISRISLNMGDTLTACSYLMRKGHCFQKIYNYEKAFETYEQVYNLCKNEGNTSPLRNLRTESLVLTIKTANFLGFSLYSIEKCYELLAMEQSSELQLLTYSYLALYMQEINNKQDALEAIHHADRIFRETTDTLRPAVLKSYWNNKAGIYFYHNQTDSAIFCLNKALSYIDLMKNDIAQSNFNLNLARVYWQIGEYKLAKHSYQKIFRDIRKVPVTPLHVQTIGDYGRLCLNMNQLDSARLYCKKALFLADSIQHKKTTFQAQLLLSEILYKDGKYQESRDLYVSATNKLDSIQREQNNSTTLLLHREFNNQKLKQEHKQLLLKHDELLQKSHMTSFFLTILVFVFLCTTIYCMLALLKKRKELKLGKVQRDETQSNLRRAEQMMEQYTIDKKIQEDKLQNYQRTVLLFQNIFQNIEKKLEDFSHNRTKKTEDTIQGIQEAINELNSKPEITACSNYMNQQAFNEFCKKIQTKFPILTEEEIQICFLLAINISEKDIATRLNKSVRTIEYKVYQLRKKIEIPSQVKTVAFFQDFL